LREPSPPSGPAARPITVTSAPPAAALRPEEGKSIRESGLVEGRLLGRVGGWACRVLLRWCCCCLTTARVCVVCR
jgi:hypothetical protein